MHTARAAFAGLCLLLAQHAHAAVGWRIDHGASRLGFIATQQGGKFRGQFHSFRARIRFSPEDLSHSGFVVSVDVRSIDTDSQLRDRALADEAWFDFQHHPEARFETERIRHTGQQFYEATGKLTIRGTTRVITLPFAWTMGKATAHMQGRVTIDRTWFGIGQGEWGDTDVVGHKVTVVVDLTLGRSG